MAAGRTTRRLMISMARRDTPRLSYLCRFVRCPVWKHRVQKLLCPVAAEDNRNNERARSKACSSSFSFLVSCVFLDSTFAFPTCCNKKARIIPQVSPKPRFGAASGRDKRAATAELRNLCWGFWTQGRGGDVPSSLLYGSSVTTHTPCLRLMVELNNCNSHPRVVVCMLACLIARC